MCWGGDDAPSVRKPFSSVPRGCLGVPNPPAAAPPLEARSVAASVFGHSGPPLAPALRGPSDDGDTQLLPFALPTVARASPLRVGGGSRRAGAGVRRGEALRCATCGRVAAFARLGACAKGGSWLEARRPFPSPTALPAPHASCERLSVRSRPEFAAGGSACAAGTVGARLVLRGRSARDASPPPARVGPGGRANGWWMAGGSRRRLPCGGFFVPFGGSRVWFFRGGGGPPGPARREERRRGFVRLGGSARRPGRRGAALCVCGGGIPALFTRWPAQVRCLASKSALGRCARGPLLRVLRPTASRFLRARPPPGGHRRRTSGPPPPWSSCRPRLENRPPAVRVSPLGPTLPPRWWWGGVGGVPGQRVLSGRARCCRPGWGVLCVSRARVRPGGERGDSRSSPGFQGRWPRPLGGGALTPPRGWF